MPHHLQAIQVYTVPNLRNLFYFNMLREVQLFISKCGTCQRRRGRVRRAPMLKPEPAEHPPERVSMDVLTLPTADTGHKIVLSIVDHHSRFLTLVPLTSLSTIAVTRAFLDSFVAYFGPPRQLTTDNGGEFCGDELKDLCEAVSIYHGFTLAWHPHGNGIIERTNRVVQDTFWGAN